MGIALHKLDMVNAAQALRDLRSPGNRLEPLRGNWRGFRSIRVNELFRWVEGAAHEVRLLDYHRG